MNRILRLSLVPLGLALACPALQAREVSTCPTATYYYVFFDSSTITSEDLHNYVRHEILTFLDGKDRIRTVDERGADIVNVVCIENAASFEAGLGINSSTLIQGELFQVKQVVPGTWPRIGTVWKDVHAPFADSGVAWYGGVAYQELYKCLDTPLGEILAINNVGAHGSGLDRSAITGTSETVKEFEYFQYIHKHLFTVNDAHMSSLRCVRITKSEYSTLLPFLPVEIHLDSYDPSGAENAKVE
jgi:hypothetical protein